MNPDEKIDYLQKQLQTARNELNNVRKQIISLKKNHVKDCEEIYKQINLINKGHYQEPQKDHQKKITLNNGFPVNFIGIINTDFSEKRGTPRQPSVCSLATGKITLNNTTFTNPNHALEGLQSFSHMWIMFYFHKNNSTHVQAKVAPPRLNGDKLGVFATRSPHRPNPIGLSLVKIELIKDNCIFFSGVDMIDGTPVIDLKPYIPNYDNPNYLSELNIDENSANFTSINDGGFDTKNIRTLVGEEKTDNILLTNSCIDLETNENLLSNFADALNLRDLEIGERQAPDGEEQEISAISKKKPLQVVLTPDWIDKPSISKITVLFKDKALEQLSHFTKPEEKKQILINILQEDPRSVYLREKWSSHCYVFRIKDMCVSCKFDDTFHTVTVYQIFQNSFSENIESH